MKHRVGYNRLGRKSAHRKALVKNMVTQLYRHERIRTTKAKALEVRRRAEKLITRAKEDSVHNRRIVGKLIQDKAILAKLFTEIAPGFVDRPGGYTRILKLGYRKGDAAEMVLLELVGRDEAPAPRKRRAKPAPKEEPAPAPKAATEPEPVAAAAPASTEVAAEEAVPAEAGETDAETGAEGNAETGGGPQEETEESEEAGEDEKSQS